MLSTLLPDKKFLGNGDLVLDAWGAQKVSTPYSLFNGMFTFDVPQAKWFMFENGSQVYTSTAISSINGAGTLTTGGAVNSLKVESRVCPRYQPNRGHLFSTAAWFPNKLANGIREFGLGTEENRVVFRLKPNGKLYAVIRSNNVDTYEVEISTKELANFDVEKGNIYDIQFQWRGVGNYYFYINNVRVHTINYLGTLTQLSLKNPALPARLYAERITEDVSMSLGCVDITSENGQEAHMEYGSAFATGVATGTDKPILIIKQPVLINGESNTRDLSLARITFTCSKKATFKVWSTRHVEAITGATFNTVNQGSYVECDSPDMHPSAVRATAVNTSLLRFITGILVEAAVSKEVTNPDANSILFPVVRGDHVIVTCTASAATADVVIEWGEHI